MNMNGTAGLITGIVILIVVAALAWVLRSELEKDECDNLGDDEPYRFDSVTEFCDNLIVRVKKLHPLAVLPQMMTHGAGAFDLRCIVELSSDWCANADGTKHGRCLNPGESITLNTGLAFQIPYGYVMLIFSRSGHGFKWGITLANSVAVIDSDYRGEVTICLRNDGELPMGIEHGDRIAQAVIIPRPGVEFVEVDILAPSERGEGGLGSTGDK